MNHLAVDLVHGGVEADVGEEDRDVFHVGEVELGHARRLAMRPGRLRRPQGAGLRSPG